MKGVINVQKPEGLTSHDVVAALRRKLKMKRIGHTGTLDPLASGVLPICIGKATRISEYLLELDKEYIAELSLGTETDTQDSLGEVIRQSDKIVDPIDIEEAFKKFQGHIKQVPPMYSALKHKGKKLYELARQGITIERPARSVKIYELEILEIIDKQKIIFRVKCSKGTYIRTLCQDLGRELATLGHMSGLKRTATGPFNIEDSYELDYILNLPEDQIPSILLPMDKALPHFEKIIVKDKYYFKLINGARLSIEALVDYEDNSFQENMTYRVYCKKEFIGMGQIIVNGPESRLKMEKVLL